MNSELDRDPVKLRALADHPLATHPASAACFAVASWKPTKRLGEFGWGAPGAGAGAGMSGPGHLHRTERLASKDSLREASVPLADAVAGSGPGRGFVWFPQAAFRIPRVVGSALGTACVGSLLPREAWEHRTSSDSTRSDGAFLCGQLDSSQLASSPDSVSASWRHQAPGDALPPIWSPLARLSPACGGLLC